MLRESGATLHTQTLTEDSVEAVERSAVEESIIRVTSTFVREARRDNEAAADLSKELDVLRLNLSRLDELLKEDEAVRPFDITSVLGMQKKAYCII